MNLLEKFSSVTVSVGNKITEEDRLYCESEQAAYQQAREVLLRMYKDVKSALEEQEKLLSKCREKIYSSETYLGNFDPDKIWRKYLESHRVFIVQIAKYFEKKYKVNFDWQQIEETLLPAEPNKYSGTKENRLRMMEDYQKKMAEVSISYESILQQIFNQLGGLSFDELAVQQVKEACRTDWHSKRYDVKKTVISFECGCSIDSIHLSCYPNEYHFKINIISTLKALVHFETGFLNSFPVSIAPLFRYRWETYKTATTLTLFDFQKVKSIKCFKNGRLDIVFSSESFAREFEREYLKGEM